MKAVIASNYGGPEVLSIKEVEKPKPRSNEILVKVKAGALNSGDVRMRSLDAGPGIKGLIGKAIIRLLVGFLRPKHIQGCVLAGEIVDIGNSITRFSIGDEVFAMTGFHFGAFAEYCVLPQTCAISLKPQKASFEEASALPFGGNTALYFLRKAGLKKGKRVFIYGATGSVGTSAVQISKYFNAEVTAVSGPEGIEMTKELGASQIYNYREISLQDIKGKFDIVFDAVGKISKKDVKHLINDSGQYITVNSLDVAKGTSSNLEEIANMYDNGMITANIDKIFDLDDIIEANRYVDSGHKKGNVVIRIN